MRVTPEEGPISGALRTRATTSQTHWRGVVVMDQNPDFEHDIAEVFWRFADQRGVRVGSSDQLGLPT